MKQFVNTSDDFMKVADTNERMVVCVKNQMAGEKWIEWRVGHVSQT